MAYPEYRVRKDPQRNLTGYARQKVQNLAAQMRERNLTHGKGCKSIAKAIQKRLAASQ